MPACICFIFYFAVVVAVALLVTDICAHQTGREAYSKTELSFTTSARYSSSHLDSDSVCVLAVCNTHDYGQSGISGAVQWRMAERIAVIVG